MNRICPVCSEELQKLRCDKCGFGMAGVDLFSGGKAYDIWMEIVRERKSDSEPYTRESLVGAFSICRDCAAVFDRRKSKVTILHSGGQTEVFENVLDVSIGDTHRVIVLKNGTLRAYGENRYGQCSVDGVTDAVSACAGDTQTYIIQKNGRLASAGDIDINILEKLKKAENIVSASAGLYNCALLDNKGDVTFIGNYNASSALRNGELKGHGIKTVRACNDAVVCIDGSGNVYYFGTPDGRAEAGSWKNIIDIAVDSHCAVGLMKDGKLKIAYKNKNKQRFSEIEEIEEASALASGRSCIAVISSKGDLVTAGNIRRSENIVNAFYSNAELRKMFILK